MTFDGWPEEALDFYEGLEADNSKAYWTAHKDVYENAVRAPMLALLADLAKEFGEGKMFRPYRDTRFAKDKSPYKTNAAAVVSSRYVSLSAAGLVAGGGVHETSPDEVARLRAAVDSPARGTALARIVANAESAGYRIGGDQLKTVPRGFDRDHPRAELLKYKSLFGWQEFAPAPWLHTAKAADVVATAWRGLEPLTRWLADNVRG